MRAKLVLVGNEKGGSGKTTLATNLAAIAAGRGLEVLLVDADPGQASSSLWAGRRNEDHPTMPKVTCVELRVPRDVKPQLLDLGRHYDVIVVDTGAVDSPHLRACAMIGHVLAIPVQSDGFDIWTLPAIARIYAYSRDQNPTMKAQVIMNRLLHHTAEEKPPQLREWMMQEVPELPSDKLPYLVARSAYGKASTDGLAVTELTGRDFNAKAAAEMLAVYEEVMG